MLIYQFNMCWNARPTIKGVMEVTPILSENSLMTCMLSIRPVRLINLLTKKFSLGNKESENVSNLTAIPKKSPEFTKLTTIGTSEECTENAIKETWWSKSKRTDPFSPVSTSTPLSCSTRKESSNPKTSASGSRKENLDPNGPRLATPCYAMVGEKKMESSTG